MLKPWRWSLTLVGVSVLLGAVLELAPPLLVKQIVDEHLKLGRSEGLLWIAALYLIAGGIVAATHHYWAHLHTLRAWGSALLATVLWPLILLGINLHIH